MMAKQPAMEWRPTLGVWLLRTETPLPEWAVQRCVAFMLKVQAARRLGLMPGDTRDDLDASVKALREGKVKQWAAGAQMDGSGDIEVYRATQGTGKVITLGAR
jgi:hypothetical protein